MFEEPIQQNKTILEWIKIWNDEIYEFHYV